MITFLGVIVIAIIAIIIVMLILCLRRLKNKREGQRYIDAINFIEEVESKLDFNEIRTILTSIYGPETAELALRKYKEQNNNISNDG